MRILYVDCDTTRPDHLGCYGYHRNTSPNIDRVAKDGVVFTNYYASDAPCLPSRSGLINGRFGIHTGVVGHGGTGADLRLEGEGRGFGHSPERATWVGRLNQAGYRTVTVSPFAERHGAWWFYNGFTEMMNPGKRGNESAEDIAPWAMDWLARHAVEDNWFLHVNFWDPHTPYRVPESYGNPFQSDAPPAWHTEEVRASNWEKYGAHCARCPRGYPWEAEVQRRIYPNLPDAIASLDDYKRWIDGYDTGIRYMDDHIGRILDSLDSAGVLDETAIIVSADHGENQGELGIYGDHMTADHITSRVPFIVRWPGAAVAGTRCGGLHYNVDFAPTIAELAGADPASLWDGTSFAGVLRGEACSGRDSLVVSQCAWTCQRAVRWKNWILVRTYDEGLRYFPDRMLFDVESDPHETCDLAEARPETVNEGLAILEGWTTEMMWTSDCAEDPLWRVIREGGPLHTRGHMKRYCWYLRENGQSHHAVTIEARNRHGA